MSFVFLGWEVCLVKSLMLGREFFYWRGGRYLPNSDLGCCREMVWCVCVLREAINLQACILRFFFFRERAGLSP